MQTINNFLDRRTPRKFLNRSKEHLGIGVHGDMMETSKSEPRTVLKHTLVNTNNEDTILLIIFSTITKADIKISTHINSDQYSSQ